VSSRQSLWTVAGAVWWRNAHNFFTNPAFIIPSLLFPLFFFTAFAGGLSRISEAPGFNYAPGYTSWIYGFVLLQSSAFGGVFTGFSVARDYESGFARRLMLAAHNRGGIVVGYMLGALTRAAFTILVVTVVALVAGLELDGNGIDLTALLLLSLAINVAGSLFSTGVAMRLRTMQAGPLMQTPVFLLMFLAPVWVPYDLLSGWLKSVASVNPVTALLEASRSLIAGDPVKLGLAFGLSAAMVALFAVWARGGLHSAERSA
jgi:ABC-2 type transport system permease protein